jgi:hypothetical protein
MKYAIRLIVLPFWATCYLIFAIYLTFIGFFKMCYDFIIYGGEQVTYDKKLNRDSILKTYLKLEEIEASFKVDPRSQCNHVWEQEVSYGQTTAPRQKCVVCGVQLNNNHFTK